MGGGANSRYVGVARTCIAQANISTYRTYYSRVTLYFMQIYHDHDMVSMMHDLLKLYGYEFIQVFVAVKIGKLCRDSFICFMHATGPTHATFIPSHELFTVACLQKKSQNPAYQ
jgi:hypothetical protein